MRAELVASRRQWENRLLAQTASRWGLSPFSLVLRAYQGIGGLVSGALLYRARTPAQMALWGAMEGMRDLAEDSANPAGRSGRRRRRRPAVGTRPSLRKAAIIVEGYVAEAGLDRDAAQWNTVAAEAETAATGFVARVSSDFESLVAQLGQAPHRLVHPLALRDPAAGDARRAAVTGWARTSSTIPGWRNIRCPSTGWTSTCRPAFWLLLWCLLLLWAFCSRLRRGLRARIDQLAAGWQDASSASGIFTCVEADCRRVEQFRQDLEQIRLEVSGLQRELALP